MINIYVGNLPYSTSESELGALFSQYGEVVKSAIILDRETGRSRGFGFVEMPEEQDGRKAIEQLNGSDFNGRSLTINEARPRGSRGGGGGFDRGTGGGYQRNQGYSRGPGRRESRGRGGGYSRGSDGAEPREGSTGYSNERFNR